MTFRRMVAADYPRLVEWFADPVVVEWFGPPKDLATVEAKYGPRVRGDEPVEMWIPEIDGVPAGMLQCYAHDAALDEVVGVPDAVGIDYLIAAPFRGRGIAGTVLGEFASLALERFPARSVVVATPNEANAASCAALRSAGLEFSHTSFPASGARESVYVMRNVTMHPRKIT